MDKKEEFERLKKELKAICPQNKCKLMTARQFKEHDNMETLFKQNRLNNLGRNLAQESESAAQEEEKAPLHQERVQEGDHVSSQGDALPVPQDRLS